MLEFFSPQNLNNLWTRIASGHALIATAIVISLLLLLRSMILRIAYRNIDDKFVRLRYKRGLSYIVLLAAIFLLLPIWLPSLRSIATFLGIFGAGFLIVTRELWLCVGGWVYIVIRRPYVIGDRIQLSGVAGDVIDIRLMETSLMEVTRSEGGMTTGKIIYFPNSKIFTEIISTTSKSIAHVFQEINVVLDVAADWEAATLMLEKLAKEEYDTALATKEQLEAENEETDPISGYRAPRVMTEMQNGNVLLHLQFMAPTGQAANMTDRIWRGFLKAAAANPAIRLPNVNVPRAPKNVE